MPVTRWPDENPNAVFVRFVLHARRAPDVQSGGGSADGGKPPHQRRGNRSNLTREQGTRVSSCCKPDQLLVTDHYKVPVLSAAN
ncbi:MAG: hypothetical protein ACP5I8_12330 [Phycisphaerae bacterium]